MKVISFFPYPFSYPDLKWDINLKPFDIPMQKYFQKMGDNPSMNKRWIRYKKGVNFHRLSPECKNLTSKHTLERIVTILETLKYFLRPVLTENNGPVRDAQDFLADYILPNRLRSIIIAVLKSRSIDIIHRNIITNILTDAESIVEIVTKSWINSEIFVGFKHEYSIQKQILPRSFENIPLDNIPELANIPENIHEVIFVDALHQLSFASSDDMRIVEAGIKRIVTGLNTIFTEDFLSVIQHMCGEPTFNSCSDIFVEPTIALEDYIFLLKLPYVHENIYSEDYYFEDDDSEDDDCEADDSEADYIQGDDSEDENGEESENKEWYGNYEPNIYFNKYSDFYVKGKIFQIVNLCTIKLF